MLGGKVNCWMLNMKSKNYSVSFKKKELFQAFSFPPPFLAIMLCVVNSFGSRMVARMDGWVVA